MAHLGTQAGGLSSREAQRRLAQFGANQISRAAGPGWWRELVRQLAHPLALLLWVAAALAAASGSQTLAIAIVAVIVLNAALAYAQELQAERATEALHELLPNRARVRTPTQLKTTSDTAKGRLVDSLFLGENLLDDLPSAIDGASRRRCRHP